MTSTNTCQCMCHIPGLTVRHVVACCNGSDDTAATLDDQELRDLHGGQSPPDDRHFYVGGKDFCDSAIATAKALGRDIECWHGDSAASTCRCRRCLSEAEIEITWMVVCGKCGNKRCPHANDHRNKCTGSNEPGQPGSAY